MISLTTHFNLDVCMDIASYDAVKARQMLFSVPSMDEAMKLAAYRIPKKYATRDATRFEKRFLTFLEAALKGSQQEFSPDLLVNSPEVLAPNFGFISFSRFFFPSPPFDCHIIWKKKFCQNLTLR